MTTEIISKSIDDTKKIAGEFVKFISNHFTKKLSKEALVVGFSGDLGSGKTTFTQSVAETLGITESVTSPTFVIEKIYQTKNKTGQDTFDEKIMSDFPIKQLVHIDAYRLDKGHDLEVLGFKELIKTPNTVIIIEWPEKVTDILPIDTYYVNFRFVDEQTRAIMLSDGREN